MITDYLLTIVLLLVSYAAFFYAGIRCERMAVERRKRTARGQTDVLESTVEDFARASEGTI